MIVGYFALAQFKQTAKGVERLDAKNFELKSKEDGILLLDVRTPGEFHSGHIKGALNIDINGPGFKEKIQELDAGKTILVYCHSGARSAKASKVMSENGFSTIFDLSGGIISWKSQKLPVE